MRNERTIDYLLFQEAFKAFMYDNIDSSNEVEQLSANNNVAHVED